jgi:hypothetical protein
MTQSVIVQNQKGMTYAFIKGSSESIEKLLMNALRKVLEKEYTRFQWQ